MKSTLNLPSKVTVTQEHIDHGQRKKCTSCPIALALHEQFPQDTYYVGVYLDWLTVSRKTADEEFAAANLPRSAQRFIQRFDKGNPVVPFTFKLQKRA